MKTTIRIQNFKSLEDVTFELAPTTVFLGPNGAGKSSVLKCLEFVSKNLENINSQKISPTIYKLSNEVDLGSYNEVVTKNNTQRDIIFSFKHQSRVERDYKNLGLSPLLDNINDFRVLTLPYFNSEDRYKEEFNLKFSLFEEWLGNSVFEQFSKAAQSELLMINFSVSERLKFISKYFNKLNLDLKFRFTHSDDNYNFKSFRLVELSTGSEIVFEAKINPDGEKVLLTRLNFNDSSIISKNNINQNFVWEISDSWHNYKALIENLIFWHTNNYGNQFSFNNDISQQERLLLKTIATIVILFETTPHLLKKFLKINHLPSIRLTPNKQKRKTINRRSVTPNALLGNLTSFQELQAILLAGKIESIQMSLPEGEKVSPDHLEVNERIFLKTNPNLVKKHFGRMDVNYLLINLINSLRRLNLAKNIYIKKENKTIDVMVETLSGAHINFSESSSGLIQLYPILAAKAFSFFEDAEYIFVEQPELHLHPQLQSNIAEICANLNTSQSDAVYRRTKFIVETHSEHLIRGYQLLIAQGKIKPQHIRFYYFNPVDNKTKVTHLKVDKLGNFITPWPSGFFSEASDLSYKLLEEQLKRQK